MTLGLLATAFAFGLRHGMDWDHLAAISDLVGSARSRRRGFRLSFVYAIGHAVVVLVLGAAAILFGASIPQSLDEWMGRVVGFSLIALGIWVLVGLGRNRTDFRLRSRWMLLIGGAAAGIRRVTGRSGSGPASLAHEHEHEHEHEQEHEHEHAEVRFGHNSPATSHHRHESPDHRHVRSQSGSRHSLSIAAAAIDEGRGHSHKHRHELAVPSSATDRYGFGAATGIGMLHGVGVESPTQIAVFVASTSIGGAGLGLLLLVVWVVGLVVSNAALAVLAGSGLLHPERNATVYRLIALVVAVASIGMGVYYLTAL